MNDPRQNECLLADVLGEGTTADFRDGLLRETLRLARRRRGIRQARRASSALAVLIGLGVLVWHQCPSGQAPARLRVKPYALVRTQPLSPTAWVVTRHLSPANLVVSTMISSVVLTAQSGVPVRELDDDELLALAPGPAALVRHGPHSAALVFVNAGDRDGFLRN